MRIQSEAALRLWGVVTVGYAANSQRVEFVYVRVRHPDGTVVETAGTEAVDISPQVTQQAPFYSDLKQKQLPVRSLKVGDKLEWQVRLVRTKAEAPGQFWAAETFLKDAVVLAQTLELRAPKGLAVKTWSPNYLLSETDEDGEHVWRWESSQKKPTVGPEVEKEKEAKKKVLLTAAEELDEKEGKLPDVAWTTFRSWAEVGAWYRGLEGERMMPDAEVKAKVAEVTAGKTTEEDKVRAVYGYVATQVRYVGVDFGIGRYQPHAAGDVLSNQYGDCKDKHTLLAAMLEALGLKPDAVLVGAGIRFNEAVPSPGSFNHVITRVEVGGQPVWLDTTTEVAPYRVLLGAIRDHEALVIPETGTARLEKTPAKLPFQSVQTMDAKGELDAKGVSTSRIVITLRGETEVFIRSLMRQIQPGQWDLLVQKMSEGMGYQGTASHAELSRAEDTSEPLRIAYDYKREKPGDWENHRILAQVAPVGLPTVDEKEPPVSSIQLGDERVETSVSAMKLPDGWGVEVPEAIHAKSAYATVDQTWRFEKGVLYSERKIEVLREKVPAADWKAYKKFADAAELGQEEYVQLVHLSTKGSEDAVSEGKAETPGKPSNAEAAKLIQDAMNALQRFDTTEARSDLDKAKGLNPAQPKLWLGYGTLETALGAPTAALEDFKKELALHPNSLAVYRPYAQMQLERGLRKEAEATLRQWERLDDEDPAPGKMLAQLLLDDGDAAGAASEAKLALAKSGGADQDRGLQLLLGRAQLRSGAKDEGRETLVALLEAVDDPLTMNDAAYELGDAGLELPLAEKTARAALAKMETESQSWTLDENPQTLASKSRLIAATWDTVGWILFREGRVEEGEGYIRAAWLNRQSAEVGEHLAEIALKKGDKDAALTAYELALSTLPWQSATLNGKTTFVPTHLDGVDEKRLTAKVEELRKAGAKSSAPNPHEALQKLRVVPLGAADGLSGASQYRMLVSAEKVERVEATGDKPRPAETERLMKVKLPGWVPAGSQARVVKVAMLICQGSVCELGFQP